MNQAAPNPAYQAGYHTGFIHGRIAAFDEMAQHFKLAQTPGIVIQLTVEQSAAFVREWGRDYVAPKRSELSKDTPGSPEAASQIGGSNA